LSLSESYQVLAKVTKDLARQRSEVDRLWREWSASLFADLRAKRIDAKLLIINGSDSVDYYALDTATETISLVTSNQIIQMSRPDSNNDAGTECNVDIPTREDSDERLQEAAQDTGQSPSGGEELQGESWRGSSL
jgi:hypothetical protein